MRTQGWERISDPWGRELWQSGAHGSAGEREGEMRLALWTWRNWKLEPIACRRDHQAKGDAGSGWNPPEDSGKQTGRRKSLPTLGLSVTPPSVIPYQQTLLQLAEEKCDWQSPSCSITKWNVEAWSWETIAEPMNNTLIRIYIGDEIRSRFFPEPGILLICGCHLPPHVREILLCYSFATIFKIEFMEFSTSGFLLFLRLDYLCLL